ncbi:nicotianamine synthase family protein [Paenibacillus harenae]|uniref:2-polyprenyl-3-methyl-5-hydroxy-6-metoxy-1, 4-benzoquinol methylase n=1 Tax=Paenibacillus harenae TaxID=306543 RepID=A0ABT9TZG6_PAEHA|nr:nicotianamine synthase family protein [Paenibacillus harenae]MDQ0112777.1 2-polyprenyl-3-methyl-5-hydroxy-6-metoxy-1,4-benzoquinol methylase [Paenibacillus harenae]
MNALENVQAHLTEFSKKFDDFSREYNQSVHHFSQLERVIDDYSKFITDRGNKEAWERLEREELGDLNPLVSDLRRKSALCVAIMEKYRAIKLQDGKAEITDYFKNIEACIEKEFGSFQVASDSKVILVGSGAFPMTPLLIAKRTGAEVVGIDIDEEALQLGRKVVEKLGNDLNIRLEKTLIENLAFAQEATHIIFSSTVEIKYELLDQLHALTNEDVVVAMRYGNGFKSLFNYPMQEVDENKWKMVDDILRPDDVFDIALYKKV